MRAMLFWSTLLLVFATPLLAREVPPANEATLALVESLGLTEDGQPSRSLPGWQAPQRVAVYAVGDEAQQQQLLARATAVAGDAEVFLWSNSDLPGLADADVILGFCSPAVLEAAPEVRWLHSFSVGVERCTLNEMVQGRDFIMTNNQRGTAPDIAEHTIAMMLGLTRNLDYWMREQAAAEWSRGDREAVNVNGKTMLVLGLGGIGTEIARRAHGLGMRVIATRNSSREGPEFVDKVGLSSEMLELAGEAQVVANALPLTDDTRGMVNAEFFAALPPGAFYLSVGRGATTDTEALTEALASGHLAGAGLDVTDPEPLPADHALWAMENVIITPHISSRTDESRVRTLAIGIENLRRWTQGLPLLSVVDFERGY